VVHNNSLFQETQGLDHGLVHFGIMYLLVLKVLQVLHVQMQVKVQHILQLVLLLLQKNHLLYLKMVDIILLFPI